MSWFDGQEYRLVMLKEELDEFLENYTPPTEPYETTLDQRALDRLKKTSDLLAITYAHMVCASKLLGGDDGSENYHKRLRTMLEEIGLTAGVVNYNKRKKE